ncbi:MAG: helix-turn-helix domain-containing protein, partial [Kineosporiaceae bacterium]
SWREDQWVAGAQRLRERGWTDTEGRLTDAGRAARDDIERRTDQAASGPWRAVGTETTDEAQALLREVADAVVASGVIPFPNPIGMTWPPPGG